MPPRIDGPGDADRSQATDLHGVLGRTIRHFDFEDRESAPVDLPAFFHRIGPTSSLSADGVDHSTTGRPGFPLFGRMVLTRTQPVTGNWCFAFALDGASMAARVPPKVIPVLPGADYTVSVFIRTEGLKHARARLVAMLYDQHGRPIEDSTVTSELLNTHGDWQEVAIRIPASPTTAADLVIELQALQPIQYETAVPGQPQLRDVRGHVYFDDLIVRHEPRVEIETSTPGDTFIAEGERHLPIELQLTVHDMTAASLTANLRVRDLGGRVILEESMPVGRRTINVKKRFVVDRFGYYSAEIDVLESGGIIAQRRRDFIVIPARSLHRATSTQFGVSLETEPVHRLQHDANLLLQLGLGTTVIPAWTPNLQDVNVEAHYQALREIVEPLLIRGVDVVFVLPSLPHELASEAGVDPTQVLDGLTLSDAWLPYLEPMLVNLGERIRRWQIGRGDEPVAFWRTDLEQSAAELSSRFARLVSQPIVLFPWSAEQSTNQLTPGSKSSLAVRVPYQLDAAYLGEFAKHWPDDSPDMIVVVEPLPADRFTSAARLADACRRALELWRAGAPSLLLPSPWVDANGERPDPILAIWSALGSLLDGSRFAGEVPIARDVTAWLIEHTEHSRDARLVLWRDGAIASETTVRAKLANGPITIIDVFGNRTTVALGNNEHTIPIGDLPVFVEGIDRDLARFRQGLSITPAIVTSEQKLHEHEIVLTNPWPVMITGIVHLREPSDWQYLPRRHTFAIAPNEEIRLPFTLTFSRSELTGPKQISLDLSLQAESTYHFTVGVDFEISMPSVNASPLWRIVTTPNGRRDVVIDYFISNTGSAPLTLDAYLLAPNFPRERRIVSSLAPGATAIRTFYLEDGLRRLAGEQVFLGVQDVENGTRLNQAVAFPAEHRPPMVTETTSSAVPRR